MSRFWTNSRPPARKFRFLAPLLISLSCSAPAISGTLRPSVLSGLMQQPSSQYYNFVYGGQFDVAKKNDAAFVRAQYLERPEFRNSGYQDQDFSTAFMFGANVFKEGRLGLNALIGGGYAWGYIKELQSNDPLVKPRREAYRLPGLATAFEGHWTTSYLDVRFTHQTMICQNSKTQLEAYVAWPFTWFLLSVSSPVSFGG